jgi:broad specificity phosphatase PhoE
MISIRLSERQRGDGDPEIDRSNSVQAPPIYTWDHLRREMNQEWRDRLRGSRLLFIRHGLTWYNLQNKVSGIHNTKLSPKGVEQARTLATRLSETRIDFVFSSDLDRALQTAEIFVNETQLPTKIRLDSRLREVNLGVIQGTVRQQLIAFESGDIDFRPEKGESYRDAARRVASFVLDAAKLCRGRESNTTIAVFTHTGVMRIIGTFLGIAKDPRDLFRQNYLNTNVLVCGFGELHISALWLS